MKYAILALAACIGVLSTIPALADPAPFDLAGPQLRITVSRQGISLPIAEVPQLAAGDKLSVETELPPDETAHYLLIAAFLRDPTNPPPNQWFRKSLSWKPAARGGGPIEITIPAGAQHLVLFLAPATGGDFNTLRQAVKARPGAFVRAAQDLEQASLDRSRYDAYLAAIRKLAASDPERLAHVSPTVAASLHIKINEDCLQRQPEFQAACLLDAKEAVVLGSDDSAGSGSMSAAATDLALSVSATPAGGLGTFSPYISTIHDIIGIFSAMHTAKYQYIPALGVASGNTMALVLNTPPSFADPKSVLMAALPPIRSAHPPLLVSSSAAPPCLGAKEPLVPLAIDPLFYATGYARDVTLRVDLPGDRHIDLPLTADAARGGLVIGAATSPPTAIATPMPATLPAKVQGMWGFDRLAGPTLALETPGDWKWQAEPAGKDDGRLLLTGAAAACVSAVTVTSADGVTQPASWKGSSANGIAVTLPAIADRTAPVVLAIAGPEGTMAARVTVAPPAKAPPPFARIIAHSSEPGEMAAPIAVVLDSPTEIPADARLSFTLKASGKEIFTGHESVEVGTADGDDTIRLTLGGGLTRVDSRVMVASLIPAQALGMSAFGPLRARLVRGGVAGDWLSLDTLVRLPRLKQLTCPNDRTAPCTLSGDGLYLLAAIAATPDFDGATSVPEGYPGFTLSVPHPGPGRMLFVRLHDAPEVINHLALANASTAAK